MIKLLICGINGAMGKTLNKTAEESADFYVVAGVDTHLPPSNTIVFPAFSNALPKSDVIIDFSRPSALEREIAYAKENHVPLVVATTGLNDEDFRSLRAAAKCVPIFYSPNFSLGVYAVKKAVETLRRALPNVDVCVIERHHKNKKDAPSGTAKMLMTAAKTDDVFSVRGGTIVGEHEVCFSCKKEQISIVHRAESKKLFALGALAAAKFLIGKPNALYSMDDMFNN